MAGGRAERDRAAAGHRPSCRRTGGTGRAGPGICAALRDAGAVVPVAATPTGSWWYPVIAGAELPAELAAAEGVVWHAAGDAVLAPPSEVPDGWVHWRVAPALCGYRAAPADLIFHAALDAGHALAGAASHPGAQRPAGRDRGGHAVLAPRAGRRLAPVDAAHRAAPGDRPTGGAAPGQPRPRLRGHPPRSRTTNVAGVDGLPPTPASANHSDLDAGAVDVGARRRGSEVPTDRGGNAAGRRHSPPGPGRRRAPTAPS